MSTVTLQSTLFFQGLDATELTCLPIFGRSLNLVSSDTVHSPERILPNEFMRRLKIPIFQLKGMTLCSLWLVFHELPQHARLIAFLLKLVDCLRPGGCVALTDMNPGCDTFANMPLLVFTLLKSTEPYLDEYLGLDLEQAMYEARFHHAQVTINSPRHRLLVAQVH